MFETLFEQLNNELDFQIAEFAWTAAPSGVDYGTLSLGGEAEQTWADGHRTETASEATLEVITRSNGINRIQQVEAVLNSVEGLSFYREFIEYEDAIQALRISWILQWVGV